MKEHDYLHEFMESPYSAKFIAECAADPTFYGKVVGDYVTMRSKGIVPNGENGSRVIDNHDGTFSVAIGRQYS